MYVYLLIENTNTQRGEVIMSYWDCSADESRDYYRMKKHSKEDIMETIKEVLMERDGMTEEEAEDLIEECRIDLHERLAEGEMPYDICAEYFGLEPDYLEELVYEYHVII